MVLRTIRAKTKCSFLLPFGQPPDPDIHFFPIEGPFCRMDKLSAEMCALAYETNRDRQWDPQIATMAQKYLDREEVQAVQKKLILAGKQHHQDSEDEEDRVEDAEVAVPTVAVQRVVDESTSRWRSQAAP